MARAKCTHGSELKIEAIAGSGISRVSTRVLRCQRQHAVLPGEQQIDPELLHVNFVTYLLSYMIHGIAVQCDPHGLLVSSVIVAPFRR
jgi:hypothetical protein